MKIAIAQIDTISGDIAGNADRILQCIEEARAGKADLCVFPELAVTGYAPYDLLLQNDLVDEAVEATRVIARSTDAMTVILGTVEPGRIGPGGYRLLRNTAVVMARGEILAARAKSLLPSYGVFHETRYFEPATERSPVEIAGRRIGLMICEDMWDEHYPVHPAAELQAAGAEILIVISASPYRNGIRKLRLLAAQRHHMPLVYANGVGAFDELIFDGGSFVLGESGEVVASLPRFHEAVQIVEIADRRHPCRQESSSGNDLTRTTEPCEEEEMYEALRMGIRGFLDKNRLPRAYLGLSGGVDSALAACLARDALGPERVRALALPSRYTDPRSTDAARLLAERLGIEFEVVPVDSLYESARLLLAPKEDAGTTAENLQCRLRMMILMARLNRHGGMLLNTSNKTELSLGYGTLYGDMAGGLAPLGDLPKSEVYRLARWYNETRNSTIPDFILERAPTAELRPGQTDPFDYPRVSPIVEAMVNGAPARQLKRMGATEGEIARLRRLVRNAEHKRRQSPVILKVQPVSFGCGRLIPVTRA